MSQQNLLKRVVEALDSCNIPYMVTGSVASAFYGEPRATHDIDLVVDLTEEKVEQLAAFFPSPGFLLQMDTIREALANHSMFNLLSLEEGDKVDFWVLTGESFDQSRFSRRIRKNIGEIALWMPTPEDTILAKLRWCRLAGGSRKHLTDALRVYEVQRGTLDEQYLSRWADLLGIADLWQQVCQLADNTDIDLPPSAS